MKKYNVVVIGAGNIGALFDEPGSKNILTHAHAFYNSDHFSLKGFYDLDYQKSYEASKRWKCSAFESLEQAMRYADIVCCTVPDECHYAVLKRIADYNVRLVFSEKPITKTVKEAEDIINIYKEKNILFQVNYTRRFLNEIRLLRSKIKSYGKFIKGTGYYGKGILHNGSHLIDLITFILGDVTGYKKLSQIYDFYKDDPSVDAQLEVNGGSIIIQAVDCRYAAIFELDLLFENARIKILESGFLIEIFEVSPSPIFKGYKNYNKTEVINVDYDQALINAAKNIYKVLEGNGAALSPPENAMKVLRLCCILRGERE